MPEEEGLSLPHPVFELGFEPVSLKVVSEWGRKLMVFHPFPLSLLQRSPAVLVGMSSML
jgi:hypothetical protein